MRWRIWNIFTKITLILFYLCFIAGFIYLDQIYLNNKNVTNSSSANQIEENSVKEDLNDDIDDSVVSNTVTETQTTTPTTDTKTFTIDELSQYNGKGGQPAYLAIDGTVYDLSGVFSDGYHYGHPAGVDLTSAFYSRHVKSQITKYPIVGTLK